MVKSKIVNSVVYIRARYRNYASEAFTIVSSIVSLTRLLVSQYLELATLAMEDKVYSVILNPHI